MANANPFAACLREQVRRFGSLRLAEVSLRCESELSPSGSTRTFYVTDNGRRQIVVTRTKGKERGHGK